MAHRRGRHRARRRRSPPASACAMAGVPFAGLLTALVADPVHRADRAGPGADPGDRSGCSGRASTGWGTFLLVWSVHRDDDGQHPAAGADPPRRGPAAAADLRRRDRRPHRRRGRRNSR
ncbi:MAG: hypothetical protein MZW92_44745 [Comamonadaceae bacterium]|nr:hypothetical protein [Comamonadaceae bacterium]